MTVVLIKTCDESPEQYDVWLDRKEIGYLRLRHGHFSATPLKDGDWGRVVYSADTLGDGSFEDSERAAHLTKAVNAILVSMGLEPQDYEIWERGL